MFTHGKRSGLEKNKDCAYWMDGNCHYPERVCWNIHGPAKKGHKSVKTNKKMGSWFFRKARSNTDCLQDKRKLPAGWITRNGGSPTAGKRRRRQGLLLWRRRRRHWDRKPGGRWSCKPNLPPGWSSDPTLP